MVPICRWFEVVSAHCYSTNSILVFCFCNRFFFCCCSRSQISEKFNAYKSWLFGNVCGTQSSLDTLVGPLGAVIKWVGIIQLRLFDCAIEMCCVLWTLKMPYGGEFWRVYCISSSMYLHMTLPQPFILKSGISLLPGANSSSLLLLPKLPPQRGMQHYPCTIHPPNYHFCCCCKCCHSVIECRKGKLNVTVPSAAFAQFRWCRCSLASSLLSEGDALLWAESGFFTCFGAEENFCEESLRSTAWV